MTRTIIYKTRTTLAGRQIVTPIYFLDGLRVTKRQYLSGRKPTPGVVSERLKKAPRRVSGWPKMSEALAVHPDQVPEAQARAKRHGINVTYSPRGDVLVPDRNEWGKLLKLEGAHEKS